MGKCASYCMDSITNCQQNAFDDALNCGKSCAVPPHAFPLIEGVWKSLTTTKDYVYWCIDKSVTCDENCQSEVTSAYDTVFCAGGGSCTGCDLKGGVNLKSSGLALDGFTSVFGDMKYYQCPATAGSWSPVPGGDYSCEIGKCGKLILATGTAPTKIPCVTG
jgi:hypothetical protein